MLRFHLLILALTACNSAQPHPAAKPHGEPAKMPATTSSTTTTQTISGTTSTTANATTNSLDPLGATRERVRELPELLPPRGPAMAVIGTSHIAHLATSGLGLWRRDKLTAQGERVAMSDPLGLGVLGDGSVIVMEYPNSGRRLCRFDPSSGTSVCHSIAAGESGKRSVLAPAGALDAFWLNVPGRTELRLYRVPSAGGQPVAETPTKATVIPSAQDTLIPIGDGRVAFTDDFNVYRVGLDGVVEHFAGKQEQIRVLGRGGLNTIWLASPEIGLRLVRLAGGEMVKIAEFANPSSTIPFALAGDGTRLSVLWANRATGAYTVRLYDSTTGAQLAELAPAWQPQAYAEARQISLALANHQLAMANPARLVVMDLAANGKVVLDVK